MLNFKDTSVNKLNIPFLILLVQHVFAFLELCTLLKQKRYMYIIYINIINRHIFMTPR